MVKPSLSVGGFQRTSGGNHVSATFYVQFDTPHGYVRINGFQLVTHSKRSFVIQPDAGSVTLSPEMLSHVEKHAVEMYQLFIISPSQIGGQR